MKEIEINDYGDILPAIHGGEYITYSEAKRRKMPLFLFEVIIQLFKKGKVCFFETFRYNEDELDIELTSWSFSLVSFRTHEHYQLKAKEREQFVDFFNNLLGLYPRVFEKFKNFWSSLLGYSMSYWKISYDRVCAFCSILEGLILKGGETEGLTYKFATRFAYLIGNNFLEREKIFLFAKKMYLIRSNAIHGKRKQKQKIKIISEEYTLSGFIELADTYVRKAIMNYFLLSKKYDNANQIIDYLDELMLGKRRYKNLQK